MGDKRKHPLRSGGYLWGPRRVRANVSLDDLSKASGIAKGVLSMMENGRAMPRDDEHERIMDALARLTQPRESALPPMDPALMGTEYHGS